ncbi:circadian clock KaiB family protein [Pantanalinema sp. GBBB05]|uniref:circadian clock KaiB family protein n=1 Tax=Pantanalinema sp. GBBB05 TaxID=2604139 RepID=UPI003D81B351
MNPIVNSSPRVFKGIALFTPGGDLVYCIDPYKQSRWHIHLCGVFQQLLDLPEPPHFLVPCYAATIDRWLDPHTQQLQTTAEAALPVLRYQSLLNVVFKTDGVIWQATPPWKEFCDPIVLSTYRQQFPQLWENHDLLVQYKTAEPDIHSAPALRTRIGEPSLGTSETQGHVLRLFVSGYSMATERTLHKLHQLLEESLGQPYTLKVIDVSQHPDQAELDQVFATPTLMRVWPQPVRRIVGNLENTDQLLGLLQVADE